MQWYEEIVNNDTASSIEYHLATASTALAAAATATATITGTNSAEYFLVPYIFEKGHSHSQETPSRSLLCNIPRNGRVGIDGLW